MDYSRSISVPADKARPSTALKKISEPNMPGMLPSSPEIELVVLRTQVVDRVCIEFVFYWVNRYNFLIRCKFFLSWFIMYTLQNKPLTIGYFY